MIDPCDLLLPQSKLRLKKSLDLVSGNNEDDNDAFLQEMQNERLQEEVQREFAEKSRIDDAMKRKTKREFISAFGKMQTGRVPILYLVSFHHMLSFLPTPDVCRVQQTSREAYQYIIGMLPLKPRSKGNYPNDSKAQVPAIKPLEMQCNSIFHHYMSTEHFCRAVQRTEFPLLFQYACLHINTESKSMTPTQCAQLHESLAKYEIDRVAKSKMRTPLKGEKAYSQTIKPVNIQSAVVFMDKNIDSTELSLLISQWKGNELLRYLRELNLEGSNIGVANLHLLCDVFKHKDNVFEFLEYLNLSRNSLKADGVAYLKKTLYHYSKNPRDLAGSASITAPRLHTLDISNNNAEASVLLFFENALYLSGPDCVDKADDIADDNDDADHAHSKRSSVNMHNSLLSPCPNIGGFYSFNHKMALRTIICHENGYDLMDSDLMLAASVKEISWKFLETIDFSHNPLWESRGKQFLHIVLPIDLESTSRAYKQGVIEAEKAAVAAAATAAIAARVVQSPHSKQQSPVKSPLGLLSEQVPPAPECVHYRLRTLNLSFCDLNNAAIEYITDVMRSGNLQLLEELNLSGNKMSRVSLIALLNVIVKPFVGDDLSESGSQRNSHANEQKKMKHSDIDGAPAGRQDTGPGPLMSLMGDFASSLAQPFKRLSISKTNSTSILSPTRAGAFDQNEEDIPVYSSSLASYVPKCPLLRSLNLSLNPLYSEGLSSLVGVLLRGGIDQLEHLDISRVSANADSILVVSRAFNEQYMKPAPMPSGTGTASLHNSISSGYVHVSVMRLKSLKLYADIVPLSKKSVCFSPIVLKQVKIS